MFIRRLKFQEPTHIKGSLRESVCPFENLYIKLPSVKYKAG